MVELSRPTIIPALGPARVQNIYPTGAFECVLPSPKIVKIAKILFKKIILVKFLILTK